jgi:hypothetical protein
MAMLHGSLLVKPEVQGYEEPFFYRHLTAEENYLRAVYVSALKAGVLMSELGAWMLTGTAVFVGLIIANLDSITKIVWQPSLRWALVLLGFSIGLGTIVRSAGICVSQVIRSTDDLYKRLLSKEGQAILAELDSRFDVDVLPKITKPFVGPLRWWMNYSLKESTKDHIRTEKSFVKVVCWRARVQTNNV